MKIISCLIFENNKATLNIIDSYDLRLQFLSLGAHPQSSKVTEIYIKGRANSISRLEPLVYLQTMPHLKKITIDFS